MTYMGDGFKESRQSTSDRILNWVDALKKKDSRMDD